MTKTIDVLLVFLFVSLFGGRYVGSISLHKLKKNLMDSTGVDKHGLYNYDDQCNEYLDKNMEHKPGCHNKLAESAAVNEQLSDDDKQQQMNPSKATLDDFYADADNNDITANNEMVEYPEVNHSPRNQVKIKEQQLKIEEFNEQNQINEPQDNEFGIKIQSENDDQSHWSQS